MTDTEESFEDALQQAADEAVSFVQNLDADIRTAVAGVLSAFPSLGEWVKMLELRNGRYCGPGEDPEAELTPIDPCCQAHDTTYGRLGYDFSSMWSVKALLATRDADAALVSCVQAVDDEGMDEATKVYRSGMVAGFEGRVQIADWLKSQGFGS